MNGTTRLARVPVESVGCRAEVRPLNEPEDPTRETAPEEEHTPRLWRADGWIAKVIKNIDDQGIILGASDSGRFAGRQTWGWAVLGRGFGAGVRGDDTTFDPRETANRRTFPWAFGDALASSMARISSAGDRFLDGEAGLRTSLAASPGARLGAFAQP